MADLSRVTGVPIPTIKYYLREGLLPGGERTSRNQAQYGDGHVRRIKLVRALADYGGLPIATIRDLLHRAEDPNTDLTDLLGAAQATVTSGREPEPGDRWDAAAARVTEFLDRRGWQDRAGHPAVSTVIGILATMEELGHTELIRSLDAFADATELIAAADLDRVAEAADRARTVEVVVIGTLLGDSLIAALRRLAQAHTSLRLYGESGRTGEPGKHGEPGEPGTSGTDRAGEGAERAAGATPRRPAPRSGPR